MKSPYPDQGTYNPLPINMSTFARIYKENDGKTKNPRAKSNYFGRVERFGDIKTKKSKSFSVPGPGFYNVLYEWQGKQEKKDKSGEKKANLSSYDSSLAWSFFCKNFVKFMGHALFSLMYSTFKFSKSKTCIELGFDFAISM